MHRLPSRKAIYRMRIASLLVCMKCVTVPLAASTFLYGVLRHDVSWMMNGMALAFAALVVVIAQWIFAARTNCPLCITPVLMSKGCAKHRNARRLLGSHRLRVAVGILFTGSFRCPYCGEPTVLEVRDRSRS